MREVDGERDDQYDDEQQSCNIHLGFIINLGVGVVKLNRKYSAHSRDFTNDRLFGSITFVYAAFIRLPLI